MLGVIRYAAVLPTGEIVQTGTAPSHASLGMLNIPGATIVAAPDWADDDKHYWDGSAFVVFPPKPNKFVVWDGTEWFDPRTSDDRKEALDAARAATALSRIAFCERAMQLGILDPTGAKQASRGLVPESYQHLLDQLSPMERDELEIRWGGASEISRVDPFILKVASLAGFPDSLVDELFMVEVP